MGQCNSTSSSDAYINWIRLSDDDIEFMIDCAVVMERSVALAGEISFRTYTYSPRVAPVIRTFWPDRENNWGDDIVGVGSMEGEGD